MPQTLVTVDLPQATVATAVADTPSPGTVRVVGTSGDLQAALNAAVPGDVITLAAGGIYPGSFTLPAKVGANASNWITVKTAGTLPAEGTRVTPATALSNNYPKIRVNSFNPAIQTAAATCYWRFMGIEIDVLSSVTTMGGMVLLGSASGDLQNNLNQVPHHIIFDRVYAHGHATLDCRKAFAFDGSYLALVDSTVDEIHSAFDCQAVAITNGPGPFKLHNDYLGASAENINCGGADPGIAGLVPADLTVTNCHIKKNMAWRGKWQEKNLIESKNMIRAEVRGCVLENSWVDGQYGGSFDLWSVNQNGTAPQCQSAHWTIHYNIIKHVTKGVQLTEFYNATSERTNHIAINNNVWIGMDAPDIQGFGYSLIVSGNVDDMAYEHNTVFTPYAPSITWGGDVGGALRQKIRNNLIGGGMYQLNSGIGQGLVAWQFYANQASSSFAGNVVALFDRTEIPGNYYPASLESVGLAGGGGAAYSIDATPQDLALAPGSAYKNGGTDGTDPGADIPAVLAATAGVTVGSPVNPPPVIEPPPPPPVTTVLTTLTLAPTSLSVAVGASGNLVVTAFDQNVNGMAVPTLTPHTTNTLVANIGAFSGTIIPVVGVAAGTCGVTVSSGGVTSNMVQITVTAPDSGTVIKPGPVKAHPIKGPKIKTLSKRSSIRTTG